MSVHNEQGHNIFHGSGPPDWSPHTHSPSNPTSPSSIPGSAEQSPLEGPELQPTLQVFASQLSNAYILFHIKTTAIAYLNRKVAHTHKPSDLALQIWAWCLERKLMIRPEHILDRENGGADLVFTYMVIFMLPVYIHHFSPLIVISDRYQDFSGSSLYMCIAWSTHSHDCYQSIITICTTIIKSRYC